MPLLIFACQFIIIDWLYHVLPHLLLQLQVQAPSTIISYSTGKHVLNLSLILKKSKNKTALVVNSKCLLLPCCQLLHLFNSPPFHVPPTSNWFILFAICSLVVYNDKIHFIFQSVNSNVSYECKFVSLSRISCHYGTMLVKGHFPLHLSSFFSKLTGNCYIVGRGSFAVLQWTILRTFVHNT